MPHKISALQDGHRVLLSLVNNRLANVLEFRKNSLNPWVMRYAIYDTYDQGSQSSILKVHGKSRSRSRSCLFKKRGVGVGFGVVYFKSWESEWNSVVLKLESGGRIRSRGKIRRLLSPGIRCVVTTDMCGRCESVY